MNAPTGIISAPENTVAGRFNTSFPGPPAGRRGSVAGWLATASVTAALLIMIGASAFRSSWMAPPLVMPPAGPPWQLGSPHIGVRLVTIALWVAVVLGGAGVAAGLAAVRAGASPSPRLLLAGGLIAVAVLTVLPPAGSGDVLDYAAYGRMVQLGHSPYVMTPAQFRQAAPASRSWVPMVWENQVSVYGPLATGEQYLAAVIGGPNAARITFWLKLLNSVAFAAVALAAQLALRGDAAARLRAHLLWTVNPLLIWGLIAGAHIDALPAAAGLLAIFLAGPGWPGRRTAAAGGRYGPDGALTGTEAGTGTGTEARAGAGTRAGARTGTGLARALAAGAAAGVAADFKIFYALFGLGLCWLLRRQLKAAAAAATGMAAVLVATYLWFGPPAVTALIARRNKATADSFYLFFATPAGFLGQHLMVVAGILAAGLAVLALTRLPVAPLAPPGIRPVLALSAAWLFAWPYQMPWYDAMVLCLLVFYPASRLDWLVLARLAAGTFTLMPGNPGLPAGPVLASVARFAQLAAVPAVLLATAAGLAVLCACRRVRQRASPRLMPRVSPAASTMSPAKAVSPMRM